MGITSRIKVIQKHYGLTASAFADSIGVQRSSMSHIISGRNKPSLDFILKIIKQFPEVDISWLLRGEGEFLNQKPDKNEEPDLFNTAVTYEQLEKNIRDKDLIKTRSKELKSTGLEAFKKSKNIAEELNPIPTSPHSTELNDSLEPNKSNSNNKKEISRVIIFYKDGSFDNFES